MPPLPATSILPPRCRSTTLQSDRPAALTWATNDGIDNFVFEATKEAAKSVTGCAGFCRLYDLVLFYLDDGGRPGEVVDGYSLPGLSAGGSQRLWIAEVGDDIRESATGDEIRLLLDHKPLNATP